MSDEQKIRAFIALKIPSTWEKPLIELQTSLQHDLPDRAFRWTNISQAHLTLRFFGNIFTEEIPIISARLSEISSPTPSFELKAEQLGCFPNAKRPRVLWLGLKTAGDSLAKLHARINETTAESGEPPDSRPFSPHLTLARVKDRPKTQPSQLERALRQPIPIDCVWQVRSLDFLSSRLLPSGAQYETLSSHLLAA